MIERRRIRVDGRVQGVGYRWFVMRKAKALGLAGWAKNAYDGSVQIEAQGEPDNLDLFELYAKEGSRLAIVHTLTSESVPIRADERGFQIAFW